MTWFIKRMTPTWMLFMLIAFMFAFLVLTHALQYYLHFNNGHIIVFYSFIAMLMLRFKVRKAVNDYEEKQKLESKKNAIPALLKDGGKDDQKSPLQPLPQEAESEETEIKVSNTFNFNSSNELRIPNNAVSIRIASKIIDANTRFQFYLYSVDGVDIVKTVKSKRVDVKQLGEERAKRLSVKKVTMSEVLPLTKGSIYQAMQIYLPKKPEKQAVESKKFVQKTPVANEVEKPQKSALVTSDTSVQAKESEVGQAISVSGMLIEYKERHGNYNAPMCKIRLSNGMFDEFNGVDLKRAIEEAKVKAGDTITLTKSVKKIDGGKSKNIFHVKKI